MGKDQNGNGVNKTADYDFDFDSERKRLSKTVSGDRRDYVYAGNQVINEYLADNLNASYGIGSGEIVSSEFTNEGTRNYFSDALGSITSLADTSSSLISRNDYDSFGEIVSSTGSSQNSVTYTGQRLDVESGLMALGNGERYYNPSYGRFIQQDSYAGMPDMPQSLNRFSYGLNNPNTYVDPSGNEGVVADQMRSKLQNGIANTGNDTLDWWINFGVNFVAGAGYDAVNTSSGFTLGMIDRNLQKAMRGEQITVSDLTTTNWYGGNQDGWNPGNLMYNGAKGAIKTVYETGAAIAHIANPITHLNEGISAMTDPVGHSERKRQEFNQTISGAKQWFNDLTGFIGLMASDPSDAMSLLGDAANTVGPDKTAQITGSAMAEAYMIVEGGVGVAKGVKALKVMRAAKVERKAAQVAIKEATSVKSVDEFTNLSSGSDASKIAIPRTKGLGKTSTTKELLETGAIPGSEGVILNQKVVKYSDIWKMSEKSGVEFGLTRENGKFILRSGSQNRTPVPLKVKPIMHTHPPDSLGRIQPMPSNADINKLNSIWARKPNGSRPVSIIKWGKDVEKRTRFHATGIDDLP